MMFAKDIFWKFAGSFEGHCHNWWSRTLELEVIDGPALEQVYKLMVFHVEYSNWLELVDISTILFNVACQHGFEHMKAKSYMTM